MSRKSNTWLFHVLAWMIFILAPIFFSPGPFFQEITKESAISLLVRSATLVALFYSNLFYFTPVLLKKYGWVWFVSILVLLVVVISVFNAGFHMQYVEDRGFFQEPPPFPNRMHRGEPGFGPGPPPHRIMFASPTFVSVVITVLVAITSSSLVLRKEWLSAQEEKKEQTHMKIQAELVALKLQISPHFLFNTLNNIRWLVRSKSEQAEDAIVKLSHLLRYILYQTEAEEVDLEKEIDHLKDFIELQKMRILKPESLSVSIQGALNGKRIIPLLLLPLIENFFKHGDFTGNFQNSISIRVAGNHLMFKSENLIAAVEDKAKGIGFANVKKRLSLHYPSRYTLEYYEKESVFNVELNLNLTDLLI